MIKLTDIRKGNETFTNESIEDAFIHKQASKVMKGKKVIEVFYEQGTYYVELSNGKYISFDVGGMQPKIGKSSELPNL